MLAFFNSNVTHLVTENGIPDGFKLTHFRPIHLFLRAPRVFAPLKAHTRYDLRKDIS